MRIEPWVNEGFACVVSALLCNRLDLLEREVGRSADARVDDLNAALSDLAGEDRASAFAIATARVWRAVQSQGSARVFANLNQPELWQETVRRPDLT